jgi:hypothetical protein
MSGSIYAIVHTETGNEYVGMTRKRVDDRVREHVKDARNKSQTHFHRAIRKHGASAFSVLVLETEVPEPLGDAERRHIAARSPHYNMTLGGEGGSTIRGTRIIINDGVSQRFHAKDQPIPAGFAHGLLQNVREKMRVASTGRKHTEAAKEKMRRSSPTKPRVVSSATREKMSLAKLGTSHSVETKAKMRDAKLGRRRKPFSEETKAKMRASQQARWGQVNDRQQAAE